MLRFRLGTDRETLWLRLRPPSSRSCRPQNTMHAMSKVLFFWGKYRCDYYTKLQQYIAEYYTCVVELVMHNQVGRHVVSLL